MHILDLSSDILYLIISFLNPRDKKHFTLTSKYICVSSSLIKNLTLDMYTSFPTFFHLCDLFNPSSITIKNQEDPHLWLPYYPRILRFQDCPLSHFDPPCITDTEELYIRQPSNRPLYINWDKFPCIKEVTIDEPEYIILEGSNYNNNIKPVQPL